MVSDLVLSSVKVARGRFDGLVMYATKKELTENDRKVMQFSYVFPLSANFRRGYNPSAFPSIASHGANWLTSRLGIKRLTPQIEERMDSLVYAYSVNVDGDLPVLFPTLSRRTRVGELLEKFGVLGGIRNDYYNASDQFESIIKNLPTSEWARASEFVKSKYKGRGLDADLLEKISSVFFERA
jgi:hypothetical protein